jgi:hypothetical protein
VAIFSQDSLSHKNKELQESYLSCSSNKQILKPNPDNGIDIVILFE